MESKSYPGAPRWVKVAGLLAVAFVVVFAVVHLAGGGLSHHMHFGGQHAATEPAGRAPEGAH